MASQTEKDTARAQARTQADTARAQAKTSSTNAQTQADTARAQAKTSSTNAQTQADTAKAQARTQADTERAKSRQDGGDGGTSERMSQREAAAGLTLDGNDPLSGRLSSSDPFYTFDREIPSEQITDSGVHDNTNDALPLYTGSFLAIICRDGKPFNATINGEIGAEIES